MEPETESRSEGAAARRRIWALFTSQHTRLFVARGTGAAGLRCIHFRAITACCHLLPRLDVWQLITKAARLSLRNTAMGEKIKGLMFWMVFSPSGCRKPSTQLANKSEFPNMFNMSHTDDFDGLNLISLLLTQGLFLPL